ncbi:Fungal trans [Geosmithia morbida]|uniref:Fungal trans n=1 Tax=Geosmithia morbida TaxID=1094350 RepID=A0A9P5D455_9HYPO|nr:Fungal trans [Geosmithia morbida]KAF4126963.1 Fungal trans [Geosmithia morbida]
MSEKKKKEKKKEKKILTSVSSHPTADRRVKSNLPPSAPEVNSLQEDEDAGQLSEGSAENEKDPMAQLTGLVGRLAVVDDGQLHYFGSQSSLNLPREADSSGTAAPLIPRLKVESQGVAAARQLGTSVDVAVELQEHLLDLYWRWQNPWNYIVHKGAFLRSRRGQDDGRYCSPGLLSAMFAIAARFSDRVELRSVPDDPSTAGNAFCEQAKILLLYESEAPSVTTVQAAAILALRIMSDGREALGWLYCDCSRWVSPGLIGEDEIEVRKVTWWGCYVVDKLFASGLGRPSSIQNSGITCPKPTIDQDEYSPWLPVTNEGDKSSSLGAHSHITSTARYVSECMLIACEAIEAIYAPNSQLSSGEIDEIVSRADVNLRAYYTALPTYLRLPLSPKVATLPHIYLFQRPDPHRTPSSIYTSGTDNDQRQIPIAGVHLSYAAGVIHLIDARPSNPQRGSAIRNLAISINTLQDLRTAWCAWADRCLRGLQAMSRQWYRCDLSELRSCTGYDLRAAEQVLPTNGMAAASVPVPLETADSFRVAETADDAYGAFSGAVDSDKYQDEMQQWFLDNQDYLWNIPFDFNDSGASEFPLKGVSE